ncbi:MAG TPA: hypothetical protein VKR30_09765, partial [Candidatus Limnocylindrales bacterium]|nr:hypothetical protein [Candidatus Limnocylindrales bacterium]
CYALFPTITGGASGTFYVAWMDDRNGNPINHTNGWNVWLRTYSSGAFTGPSQQISAYDPSQFQSQPNGFEFPYGDYFGLDVNSCGSPELTWGEGISYQGPGHIEYRTLC